MSQQMQSLTIRVEKLEEKPTSELWQSVCDGKSPIRFNPVPDRMKEEFVGRDWLFHDIDSWLEKELGPRESRAYSIKGGPGTGKSSIARELVRRQEGKKLAGHHFFQRDNPRTCDLESLVDNLSLMLSKSFPEYAALITYSYLQEAKKFRNVPEKLFDDLITTPVQRLQGSTTHFLLISALDEGGDMIASCFAGLSRVLPSWLRVIFTARNNASALFDLFPGCNYANLDLNTSNPQVTNRANRHNRRNLEEDMRTFVTTKHVKLKNENRDNIPHFFQNDPESAITKIVKQSRCNFLFAKLVMEHIFTYQSEFVVLPPTLSEMYCLDFRRLIPDKTFFENKVAPVLEVVLAIERADIKIIKLIKTRVVPWLWDQFKSSGSYLKRVVEVELLPGITTRDLNNALKLLSVYLCEDSLGVFRFSHVSVEMWLQEEKSDFFCDVNKGHSIMAKFHLKILEMRREDPKPSLHCYLYHSSFLPEPRSMDVNFFVSDLNIRATDLLAVAFLHLTILEDFVMKVLDETHVLVTMSTEEKAEYLVYAIIRNFERVAAKLICSAYWIFTDAVQYHLNSSKLMTSQHFLKKIESLDFLPQLLFSALCNKIEIFKKMIELCVEHEVTANICVPNFFYNTEQFDIRTCWNEDAQEYLRNLKSGEKNVITLDSLKENPSSPEEAQINDYTLEVIEKPIAEVERLVKEGECYVCFTYGWHVMALSRIDQKDLELIEYLLKQGADVNNRGHLGKTALMMACEKQNIDLASFLLNHGADVEQRDFYGSTALHHAVRRIEDWEMEPISPTQERIIEMLLEHGADPRSKNSRDDSAIDIAEREGGNVLEILTRKRRRRDGPETDPDASI